MSNMPPQKVYTPFESGKFDFGIGLRAVADKERVFEFDDRFDDYIANKHEVVKRNPGEHVCKMPNCDPQLEAAVQWISAETDFDLSDVPPWEDFCTFATWLQEDLAIMHVPEKGADQLVAAHVCAPSGWSPRERLGRSFLEIHADVPEFDSANRAAPSMMRTLTREGVKERFVWGVIHQPCLNLNPNTMPDEAKRGFDPRDCRVCVRVERQCIAGLPEADAFLFTIRTYIYDVETDLTPELRGKLIEAMKSWSPAARKYKGLENDFEPILNRIESL